MDYLVTMTTRVPEGTTPGEVDEVRAREAANTARLAAEGRVLRLWRPPLKPGEWRSIGLFHADDGDDLERTLATMPLRVWRTDEVTALGGHPNDPGRGTVPVSAAAGEYLVTFMIEVPAEARPDEVADRFSGEAARARELTAEGHLLRLWTLPGDRRSLGLWQAGTAGEMEEILRTLPLAGWMTTEVVPLTRHPSDPAAV